MASLAELKQSNQQQEPQKPRTIFDFLTADKKIEKAIAAVASSFMTPDRFLRLAVNAVKKTPLLMQCDPQTVLGAFMTSAALGLEPNTPQQQAFLIPYKKRSKQGNQWIDTYECQFQVGYRGFITLAHRSPHIKSLQAEAIHESDYFDHMLGTESFLKYRKAMKDRGELIGAFAYSRLESGAEIATILPVDEIHKIRSKSETFNALERNIASAEDAKGKTSAQKKFDETPWVMWEDDMAAKSAIKKHAKQLPLTPGDSIAAAVQLDTDGDDRTIDMAAMTDPDIVRSVMADGFAPEKSEPLAVEHQEGNFLPQTIRNVDKVPAERNAMQSQRQINSATPIDLPGDDERDDQQQAAAQRQPATATNGLTFAAVNDRMLKAKDLDMLDAEADLIKEVDPAFQEELRGIYEARREQMENPPQQTVRTTARTRPPMNLE